MYDEKDLRPKKIRSALLFLFFLCIYLIILIKVFYIQIIQQPFFKQLGQKQYNVTMTTMPPRASIYDCAGKAVAMNAECLSAFILPKQLEEPQKTLPFLQKHFPHAFKRWQQNKGKHFLYIKRKLSPHELVLIRTLSLHDIQFIKEPCRFYPSETMGTIVGITDIDNNGLFGIEQIFNTSLRGKPTVSSLERDARSGHFYFDKKTDVKGQSGEPINLTIDSTLQYLAYEELRDIIDRFEALEGGVIIIKPETGEVITSVSFPDFNPNDTKSLKQEHTKNYPFTNAYEVGSVMKVLTALTALEEGVVTPDEEIDCENKITTYIKGMKVSTVKAHGIIPFSEVIQKTNNIGTVKVALRVGKKLYDYYKKLGFAEKTPISFPGEQKGFITHPSKWSKRSIISLSFGYEIRTTMLQLAQAFSAIANNGKLPYLHIIKGKQKPLPTTPLFKQKTADQIKDILTKTVLQGTAYRAKIKGYRVMGKTGTANLLENGKYIERKSIHTFAGIIEKDGYKRVMAVYVKEPQVKRQLYASMVAVPLFEQVAEKMLIHDKII